MTTETGDWERRGEPLLYRAILIFFIFSQTIDFGGALKLKYISLLPVLAYVLLRRPPARVPRQVFVFLLGLWVGWPLLSLVIGLNRGASLGEAQTFVTFGIPGLALLLMLDRHDPRYALDVFMKSLVFLMGIMLALYFTWYLMPTSGFTRSSMLWFMGHPQMGYIGLRPLMGLEVPGVYFRATLFLVGLFCYALMRNRMILATLTFITLGIAFSKAGLLACVGISVFFLLSNLRKGIFPAPRFFALIGVAITVLLFMLPNYLTYLADTLTGKEETTQIRVGHMSSYLNALDDSATLVIGQGAGTGFYSEGMGSEVQRTELAHLEAIRVFGLPWLILWAGFIVGVGLTLIRGSSPYSRVAGYSFLLTFVVGGTNPVILSPLFSILTVIAYCIAVQEQEERAYSLALQAEPA